MENAAATVSASASGSILCGDAVETLKLIEDESVNCCVTSPPYWNLRDYDSEGQIGQEITPEEYVGNLVKVFREVRRTLRKDATCWLNLGDSYAGSWGNQGRKKERGTQRPINGPIIQNLDPYPDRASNTGKIPEGSGLKPKDLVGIPYLVAFALRADGWYLRSSIIWAKPNGMPGSQQDRCTSSYEFVFMLSKSRTYWSDFDAIKTPPRESSMVRLAQDVQAQAGSHRANGGGDNRVMRAGGRQHTDKQRGHSRPHAGFNARWDAMEKSEQQSQPAMMRDVWFIAPAQYSKAHFAVMPNELVRRCLLAGCPEGGTVIDPFGGAGTVGLVALGLNRNFIYIDLNEEYCEMAYKRIFEPEIKKPKARAAKASAVDAAIPGVSSL